MVTGSLPVGLYSPVITSIRAWVEAVSYTHLVYPQKADFTFYGGIYRDVALIVVSQNHFDLDYFGGKGIKITPKLEKGCGKIHVETFVTGTGTVEISLLDSKGNQVASG